MINYEQYEKISNQIKAELIEKQASNLKQNLKKCDLENDGIIDMKDMLVFLISESAYFTVEYVDSIMKAVLEVSE